MYYLGFRTFLIILLFLCGISALYITGKRASEQQKWMQLTMMGFFATLMSYYMETNAVNITTMFLVVRIGHVAKALSALCFVKYVSQYCNVNIPRKVMNGYYIYTAWAILNIALAGYSHQFYKSYKLLFHGRLPYFSATYGWVFYVHSYGLCAAIFIVLFMITHRMVKVNAQERKRLRFLFLTGLIPVLAYPGGMIVNRPWLDPVPIAFGCSAILLFIASKQHGLLDVVQSAKESIIENTQEGVIVIDNEYNVLYANGMAAQIVDHVLDYKTGEELEEFKKLFMKDKSVLERTDKIYEVSVSYIFEKKILRGQMAWIFDVTETQNYTKEILRLKDAAEQANQAKSAFLANMSHEIRTPMNAIVGFTDLVIKQEKHEDIKEYMYDIKNSAKNLLHIINQILDISKIESGKTELVEEDYDIHNLLEDVMVITSSQAQQKDLICQTEIDANLPSVLYGSDGELREILINILNNSVKYTKEGTIQLKVSFQETDHTAADIIFQISDTGIGMKQEDVERIYDRFRKFDSMKNQGIEGSGLGMYIVKSLVTKMKGTINIQSTYGEGTTITIVIPQIIIDRTPARELIMNEEKHRDEIREQQHFRVEAAILAVDDNQVNLKLISTLLVEYGIHPDLAEDGASAIEMMKHKNYDLIFMDHMMPGMDGVETMQKIREMDDGRYRSLPIIVLTANAIAGVREKMIMFGFQDYISKPIDISQLEHALLRFLPEERIMYDLQENEKEENHQEEDSLWIEKNNAILQHVHAEEGYRNCGKKLADYQDILQFVEKQGQTRIQEIRNLLLRRDYENFTISVHALKSTAYNIGAMELGNEAKALEMAGKRDDKDYIHAHIGMMLIEYQIVLFEIKKCFHEDVQQEPDVQESDVYGEKAESNEIEEQESISTEETEEILANVRHMIDEFELDEARNVLADLIGILQDQQKKARVQAACDALDGFDVEKAQNILAEE